MPHEYSDTPDEPAKSQDYRGLQAELATLVNHLRPFVDELWPSLENHRYRWQLYGYGLPDGYDKLIVSDITAQLAEALKSTSNVRDRLNHALAKADDHNPGSPNAT